MMFNGRLPVLLGGTSVSVLIVLIFHLQCITSSFASSINNTLLPPDEVETLKEIGRKLGKNDWDFNEDPCSGGSSWVSTPTADELPDMYYNNTVKCNCSATVCHVTSIFLKGQNLSGILPPEFVRLPFLQHLDLTLNYLNGTIPSEWGSLPLTNLSILGNRLTGPIPKEFGNISTLLDLTVEQNMLSGEIPPELGHLTRLEKLCLNTNFFTGELPYTFAKLKAMRTFRIHDNNFTGKIPNFILGWKHIERMEIQGLEGPIPFDIANLTTLNDLRINDLYGQESTFPPFRNMTSLQYLILRNCNITGELPTYSFGTTNFKILDLSFNRLSGQIPNSFSDIRITDFIYLTGNLLSGPVPQWMLNDGKKIDLSYNNLTAASECFPRNTNLFAFSSKNNASGILSCLRKPTCQTHWNSLYINCGGPEVTIDGKKYEADTDSGDAVRFTTFDKWGFSSTGHFLDDGQAVDSYIATNTSTLIINTPDLYMNARRSALSLTYYGFCLLNGYYTVKLHFAEIMFTSDETYSSLGRRFFDIYIQGKLVEKDFNIEDKAGGVGKEIVREYQQTFVGNGTLEIRFYWAGKGTIYMPVSGTYGPLISAISVEDGPPSENGSSISGGVIAGISVGVAFTIMLVLGLLWWRGGVRCNDNIEFDLDGLNLISSFTLRQIKAATNNFADDNKIGEGGFGPVYKGTLSNGTVIAVKQLSSKSKQGNREFLNELGMFSALQHQNLVKMHGCCNQGNQLLLVYEYMENNSLARALFGPKQLQLELNWPTRYQICIGIARGLAYLHEESRLKVVHRDIKASNVLLDKNLIPKISDFGLAKLDEEENTHISTRVAGTYGYMAPEYALRGYLTDKADVYSYGIVVLEVVSGTGNTRDRMKTNQFTLYERALELKETGNLTDLADPRLGSEYNEEEMKLVINTALSCINLEPADRPTMSTVVSLLEGRTVLQEFVQSKDSSSKAVKMDEYPEFSQITSFSESQDTSMPFSSNSASAADLYPPSAILNSGYLEKRDIPMSHRLLP